MIRHIVLFKFSAALGEADRQTAFAQFKAGIEALPTHIPTIRHIFVGRNVNADEEWDICLSADFDTLDDLKAYAAHPLHCAVAGALKPHLSGRSCVDYEL